MFEIDHLHDDIILLLRPESFIVFAFLCKLGLLLFNVSGLPNLNMREKNQKDSGCSSNL